jgi:hypothetical protein
MAETLYRQWRKIANKKFPPIYPPHILPPFVKPPQIFHKFSAAALERITHGDIPISFHLSRSDLTFSIFLGGSNNEARRFPISFHLSASPYFPQTYASPYPSTFHPISFHLSPHILPPFTPYPSTFHPISFHLSARFCLFFKNLQLHKTLKTLKTLKTTTRMVTFCSVVVIPYFS